MAREYWRQATSEDIQIALNLWEELVAYPQGHDYTEGQFYNSVLWLLAVGVAGLPAEERERIIVQLEWAADQGFVVIEGPWTWPDEEGQQLVKRLAVELEHHAQVQGYSGDVFHNAILRGLAVVLAGHAKDERQRVIGQLKWMVDSVSCLRCGKHLFNCECGWDAVDMWAYPSR